MEDVLTRLRRALADRYSIEGELGEGGMATVYVAEDRKHHRRVALKVLKPEVAASVGAQRFLREIELAARLQHPHILPVHDSGEADGFLYYVMPYVEGESLRDRLERPEPIPISEGVRLLTEVADALSYAHAHGVVHRDIKPDNVMLSGRHALVVDFGVAKALSGAVSTGVRTATGVALGTPAYMAPEQALADAQQDHRVDIYALGVLGYEVLTGRPPFAAKTAQEVMVAHVTTDPEPVETHRAEISPGLSHVVMKCLAKQPDARWQTADEVRAQLEPLATPTGGLTPVATRPLAALRRWRRWMPRAARLAVPVIAAGAVGLLVLQLLRPHPLSITVSDLTQVTNEPGVDYLPAISPDGKEVAYDVGLPLLQVGHETGVHLVIRSTVNPIGGDEVRIRDTSLTGEFGPGWTPDGNYVWFPACHGGDCSLYETGRLGGAARRVSLPNPVLRSSWFDLSPDGARVAYFAGDTIFAGPMADSTARRLIGVHPTKFTSLHSLIWSPDGRLFAYVDGNGGYWLGGTEGRSSIWVVSAAGGTPQRVTSDEHLNISPTWLDGRHLLFVSDRDGARSVYAVEVGSGGPHGGPRIVPGVADPHTISYAAGPRQLAWAKFTRRSNVWSYPLATPVPTSLGAGVSVTSASQGAGGTPDVSADGKWIVFPDPKGISKIPVSGGDAVPFAGAPAGAFRPALSPDGREIAFSFFTDSGINVRVMSANGGAPIAVTPGRGYNGDARWSPDGRHIAFLSNRTGHWTSWVVSRDSVGGPWHPEVQLADSSAERDWAPDGSGVLCKRGDWLLEVSLQQRVLWHRDLAALGFPYFDWPRFSRDGKTVYVFGKHRDGRTGVWAIPVAGGAPRLLVVFDDPALAFGLLGGDGFAVGGDRLYFVVHEVESNIWVAKLHW